MATKATRLEDLQMQIDQLTARVEHLPTRDRERVNRQVRFLREEICRVRKWRY